MLSRLTNSQATSGPLSTPTTYSGVMSAQMAQRRSSTLCPRRPRSTAASAPRLASSSPPRLAAVGRSAGLAAGLESHIRFPPALRARDERAAEHHGQVDVQPLGPP